MNTMTYRNSARNLLLATLIFLATGLSQPAAAQAQTTPTGTGKTISAVLLGTAAAPNEGLPQEDLQADNADPDPAVKLPGMHKFGDITLKRGKID